jgi:hypothetical protein
LSNKCSFNATEIDVFNICKRKWGNISTNSVKSVASKENYIFIGYTDFFEDVGCQTWFMSENKTCFSFSNVTKPSPKLEITNPNTEFSIIIKNKITSLKSILAEIRIENDLSYYRIAEYGHLADHLQYKPV